MYKQRKKMNIDRIWAAFDRCDTEREKSLENYYRTHPVEAHNLEGDAEDSSIQLRIAQTYLRLHNSFELMRLCNGNCKGLVKALIKAYGIPIGQAFADGIKVITPHGGIPGSLGDLAEKRIFHVNYYELPEFEDFIRILVNRPEFESFHEDGTQ